MLFLKGTQAARVYWIPEWATMLLLREGQVKPGFSQFNSMMFHHG
jgi:hypothetical protein